MNLDSLLKDINLSVLGGFPPDLSIQAVTDNSRDCRPGTLFVAITGSKADGHQYLAEAAKRGATAALVSQKNLPLPPGMHLLYTPNTRRALALAAQRLAGNPSHGMTVIGVTGSKGKTTVTYLLDAIFRAAKLKTGVLGTINYRWNDHIEVEPAPQTTPSPMELARYLAAMKQAGVEAVTMEISSHAIDQCRIDGISFKAAGLTNVTRDHLDYHKTIENYTKAKERLFTEVLGACPEAVAVLNLDDPAGRHFSQTTRAQKVFGFSLYRTSADLRVNSILFTPAGMRIMAIAQDKPLVIQTPMHALFNVQNCLTAASLALAAGIPAQAIAEGLASTHGAPGRFEPIQGGQPFPIIVDYAHTPDSLTQLLLHARGLARQRLIVVFGCGGDRDPGKRPLMGIAAARLGDDLIITNDNPRTEDQAKIANAIAEGVRQVATNDVKWRIELDRRKAIAMAIGMAGKDDAVVIAGKGHENYQIVGAITNHFDDKEEVMAALAGR